MWAGIHQLQLELGFKRWRVLHCVVSFKDGGDSVECMRKRAYEIVEKHGLVGGMSVFHPFRKDEDLRYVPDGYVHFHMPALALGSVTWGSVGQDYVFKVIENPEGCGRGPFTGIPSVWRLWRLVGYLLTHCGVVEGRHALTWWGVLSYRKVSAARLRAAYPEAWVEVMGKKNPRCPVCESYDTWRVDGGYQYHKPGCSNHVVLSPVEVERLEALRVARVQEMGKVIV
jgi:hypothetical protein